MTLLLTNGLHEAINNSLFSLRFGQRFLYPLFRDSSLEREVESVNTENSNYINNDIYRVLGVGRETAKKSHPFSRFATGKEQKLNSVDVTDTLYPIRK